MKIGLVRRGYSPTGGAENYLRRLAVGLEAAGHAGVLFASPEWPAGERAGTEFHAVRGRGPAAFADHLAAGQPHRFCDVLFSLERVWQCDCYRAGDGVHRVWLERRAQAEPGWRSRWRSRWRTWNPKHRQILELEANLFGPDGPRAIIANSKLVAAEIAGTYGCAPERISVVYNGLPAAALRAPDPAERARARSELRLAEDDCAVLFAGSGWQRKGLAVAMAAVAHLPASRPAILLVAGRGNSRAFARQSAPASRVNFLGPVSDMRACYAAADIFVLPTLYDPFSNACLEALAAGLPIITTVHNGFAEVVEAGVDGEILPAGGDAVEALVAALVKWSERDLRSHTREQRVAKAAPFTITANVARTLEIVLGARGAL
jgi:UDP-glucose:(heptosyl)LPS alpha-1,3-glucosyltransferase